jgi:hypothetical protein
MNRNTRSHPLTFVIVAESGSHFCDFTPYVASINNAGTVAFQAALAGGGTGVFTGHGGPVTTVAETAGGRYASFYSHPDITDDGALSVYATTPKAKQTVALLDHHQVGSTRDTGESFPTVGPLGPTMNQAGSVAFRANHNSGMSGVFVLKNDGAIVTIAETDGNFAGFHGLPVINRSGAVAFRADLKSGAKGIFSGHGGERTPVVETGEQFGDFSLFPSINDHGTVAFGATLTAGGVGVFTIGDGRLNTVVAPGVFESVRNALINNSGQVTFAATPHGGTLGAFAGPDPVAGKVLALGDSLFGSTVAEFALNPVSVNDAGQIALRVRLADGRQFILRADPVT